MIVEGVTFVPDAVKRMSKEAFIALHIDIIWLDRKKAQRKKMLADAYDAIIG